MLTTVFSEQRIGRLLSKRGNRRLYFCRAADSIFVNEANLLLDVDPADYGFARVLQSDDTIKILGLSWSPTMDAFSFKLSSSASVNNEAEYFVSNRAVIRPAWMGNFNYD